jgi:hypothetical protein
MPGDHAAVVVIGGEGRATRRRPALVPPYAPPVTSSHFSVHVA